MRLFNKTIDRQLFKQYSLGSDLSKQEVVVKIFNPQGSGTWFILNSDPNDPDYLWAIVDLGYGAEVGSVSRSDLETYRGRFGLGFERDLGFDPINAGELYKGLRQGKFYADGGEVDRKMKVGDKVVYKDNVYLVSKIETRNVQGLHDVQYHLHSYKRNLQNVVVDNAKFIKKFADGGEIEVVYERRADFKKKPIKLLLLNKGREQKGYTFSGKDQVSVLDNYNRNKQEDLEKLWNLKGYETKYADGGSLGNYDVVIDGDWDEPKKFKTFSLAKKWIYENAKNYESLELVDPYGDTIFVEGNSTKEDLDWLFSNDEVSAFAKGGVIKEPKNEKEFLSLLELSALNVKEKYLELKRDVDALKKKANLLQGSYNAFWDSGIGIKKDKNKYDLAYSLYLKFDNAYYIISRNDFESDINKSIELISKISGKFANGGELADFSDNQRMIMNQNVQLEHHHEELEDILEDKMPVPAWVVAKMATATDSVSDITHYLDGQKELMEDEDEEEENEEEDEDQEEIENKEVVEPINVSAGTKAELTKKFTDDAFGNLKGFLQGMEGVDLREDYTFDYKDEQFEVEPIVNSDENGVSNAVFTIFDGDGEEVGEVTYSRDGGKQKFTANSEFFEWKNAKFEDGGYFDGTIPKTSSYMSNYADGGQVEYEIEYRDSDGDEYSESFKTLEEANAEISKLQKAGFKITDKMKHKVIDGHGTFIGRFEDGGFMNNVYAKGGEIDSFIPNVGTIDKSRGILKSMLIKNADVKSILSDKEFEFLKNENTDVIGVSGKPFNTIVTDGNQEVEFDLKKNVVIKPLRQARDKIKSHYSTNYGKGGEIDKAEILGLSKNIMGTTDIEMKISGMRKPQSFIVYPISKDDSGDIITIQSETRIGKIDLSTGRGLMSKSHSNGAYFVHLQMDELTRFTISESDLEDLKMNIFKTAGSNVGSSIVKSDNSGASGVYAKGGVTYYNDENQYRLGRASGSFEKEIFEKVKDRIHSESFVGNFGWKTPQGKRADGYLYKLDDYDKNVIKNLKLKQGEVVFRYVTRTTAIGGSTPFIKINIEKALLYFPVFNDNDDIIFETRGVTPLWISLIEGSFADGGFMNNVYADGGEFYSHKHSKGWGEDITIELLEPTAKGWKVKQTTKKGRKTSTKTAFFSNQEISELFEKQYADGGTVSQDKNFTILKDDFQKREDEPNRVYHTIEGLYKGYWFKAKTDNSHLSGYATYGINKGCVYNILVVRGGNPVGRDKSTTGGHISEDFIASYDNNWDYRSMKQADKKIVSEIVEFLDNNICNLKRPYSSVKFADGGQIRVGDRYKLNWTDTNGNKGYSIREIVKQNVTSGKDFKTKVMIMKTIESSMPEIVGRLEEEYKPSFKKAIERGMEIPMHERRPKLVDEDYADGGDITVLPFYLLKKEMSNEEQENVDIIHDAILIDNYEELPKGYSLKPLKSYRESGMNSLIVEVTPPKGNKFNLQVHTYELRDIEKEIEKTKKLLSPKVGSVNKKETKPKYIHKEEIKTVTIKRNGKEVTYKGEDILNGVYALEDGGDIFSKATYIPKRDVVGVELNDGTIVKPLNGRWIKKGAKPIGAEPTPTASVKSETKVGETYIRKDARNNWRAETNVENFNDYDWRISTVKTYTGNLVSSAQGGKTEPTGSKGYEIFKYTMYQDPNHTLEVSKPKRLTDKVVKEQHVKALAKFKKFMETGMFKDGGKISNFDKLSAKVAKQYEGKPVKSQYQEEYGKYYSKEEAQEVGDKVAGKVKAMQTDKKESGGRVSMKLANDLAKEIRKDGESWNDAKKRAFAELKK